VSRPISTSNNFLAVAGAAAYLTTPQHFVRRLVRERRMTVHKVWRFVRFDLLDLDVFIHAGRVEVGKLATPLRRRM